MIVSARAASPFGVLITPGGPIVECLFAWKRFTPDDVTRVSSAVHRLRGRGCSGGGIVNITGRIFAVLRSVGVPTAVNAACLVINVVLAIAMVRSSIGFTGIAWASTISFSIGAIARTWWLDRHLAKEGTRIDWASIGLHFTRTSIATGMAAIAIFISLKLVANFNTLPEFFNRAIRVGVPGFFGLLAFVGCGFAVEIPLIMDFVARIFPRKPIGPVHDPKVDPVWPWTQAVARGGSRPTGTARSSALTASTPRSRTSSASRIRETPQRRREARRARISGAFKQDLLRMAAERRPASRLRRFLGGDFIEPGFIRRNALVSLQQLGTIDTVFETTLLGALLDPDYEVRSTAARLFTELGPRLSERTREAAVPLLRELAAGSCHETSCNAIRALGTVDGTTDAIAFLGRFATAANHSIREALTEAYQALHGRKLFPVGAEGIASSTTSF
jgi:hypothetical protein